MWSKKEQFLLWILAYLPLIGMFLLKFALENKYIPNSLHKVWGKLPNTSGTITELTYAIIIVVFGSSLGIIIMRIGLKKVKNSTSSPSEVYIKSYAKPRAEHYSFFLITMLLPLFSLDVKSVTNLSGGLLILAIIILIYVKTDSISTNPLFFVTGRTVFEAEITNTSGSNSKRKIFLISEEQFLDLNGKFLLQHLVGNVYYVISSR
ncbi:MULTISPECIES: hypothetical protein [Bacillus cereus group]|uniref:Uncharacterized protein n=1 Tax=Bacillus cereus TaxID=1396 RepID=A0A9W7QKC4_BACCE|nr:hypothetical protein [Bacillus cereus]KAB2400095.1 hypothetical protein F8172_01015 [Bacillus cereus]KAB2410477.1 hypothetical protein F8170_02825 [Bacillus cereus]KAB2427729.1 hypothetical protein F8168_21755 [Bacillus cereus]